MEELVSIVVPVYNAEKYLSKCIESITAQSYKNLEIILVDDSSVDNCPQICDEWAQKDSRIRVIHKENEGAGLTRNVGLDAASGKYILFVDSDDYINEKTVEKCVRAMINSNAEVVLFSSSNIYSDGRIKPAKVIEKDLSFDKDGILEVLLPDLFLHNMGYGVSVWGKMFCADVIKEHKIRFYSEREFYSEDSLFVLEYFAKISLAYAIGENLYYYFENDTSLSRSYKEERESLLEKSLIKSIEICNENNLPHSIAYYIKARYHGCLIFKFKQIILSDLSLKNKKDLLKKEYKKDVLQSTLQKEVFNIEKTSLRLFFSLVKKRLYTLAYILLWYRTRR